MSPRTNFHFYSTIKDNLKQQVSQTSKLLSFSLQNSFSETNGKLMLPTSEKWHGNFKIINISLVMSFWNLVPNTNNEFRSVHPFLEWNHELKLYSEFNHSCSHKFLRYKIRKYYIRLKNTNYQSFIKQKKKL